MKTYYFVYMVHSSCTPEEQVADALQYATKKEALACAKNNSNLFNKRFKFEVGKASIEYPVGKVKANE